MNEFEFKLKSALEYEKEGKLLHAVQVLTPLLNEENSRRTACIRLAGIYEKLNNVTAASEILNSYLNDKPEDDNVRKFFGQFLIKHSLYEEALDILSSLPVELHQEIYFLLGIANFYLNDYKIAKINFDTFIKKNSKSDLLPEAYLYLAKTYSELGQFDEAMKIARESEKLFSFNYEVHLTLAVIYFHKKMYYHAKDAVKKALSMNEEDALLLEWAGKIFFKLGEFEETEKYLRLCIEYPNPSSETLSLLGLACLNTNKLSDASIFFDESLKINPRNREAIEGKIRCSSDSTK
ncbi:tetratricopeptide repeat protein [Bacteroidota bacterium]